MPLGCFGKRRKRDKPDEQLVDKVAVGDNNAQSAEAGHAEAQNGIEKATKLLSITTADEPDEVSDVVTVARTHSLHASAPNTVEHRHTTIGIQKSATLARYDFLRKSDYGNTADRWAALKQQYLSPSMSNSQSQHHQHPSSGQNGSVKRSAQSLPRQFAPPSMTSGPVRFSQWFYERQIKEGDARREFLEREEKTRKLVEGDNEADAASIREESSGAAADADDAATATVDAGDEASEFCESNHKVADSRENEAAGAAVVDTTEATGHSDSPQASTDDAVPEETGGSDDIAETDNDLHKTTKSNECETEEQYDNAASQQPEFAEETQPPAAENAQESNSDHRDVAEEKTSDGEDGPQPEQPEDLKIPPGQKIQSDKPAVETD